MTPAIDAEAGMRRVALALHALAPTDRHWLLGRLPRPPALRALLGELAQLGIPPDPDVIRRALDASASAEPKAQGLATDEARRLCRHLEGEPAAARPVLLASLPAEEQALLLMHWQAELEAPPVARAGLTWNEAVRALVLSCWRESALAEGLRP